MTVSEQKKQYNKWWVQQNIVRLREYKMIWMRKKRRSTLTGPSLHPHFAGIKKTKKVTRPSLKDRFKGKCRRCEVRLKALSAGKSQGGYCEGCYKMIKYKSR